MNYHEKRAQDQCHRAFLIGLIWMNRTLPITLRNYTLYTGNIKNPPRLNVSDDGSGTPSHPKNIINNRRRSESYAIYSTTTQNSLDESSYMDESYYYSQKPLQQHQLYPATLNVDKKIVLLQTEMCRTFEETGNCKYRVKCQFAHDPSEIRNIPRHPRYKTEICKTFFGN